MVLGFEPMTYGSESECATHYTTVPHKVTVIWTICCSNLRTTSLTSAGVIRKHGLSPGCIRTGQLPSVIRPNSDNNQQFVSQQLGLQLLVPEVNNNTGTQETT